MSRPLRFAAVALAALGLSAATAAHAADSVRASAAAQSALPAESSLANPRLLSKQIDALAAQAQVETIQGRTVIVLPRRAFDVAGPGESGAILYGLAARHATGESKRFMSQSLRKLPRDAQARASLTYFPLAAATDELPDSVLLRDGNPAGEGRGLGVPVATIVFSGEDRAGDVLYAHGLLPASDVAPINLPDRALLERLLVLSEIGRAPFQHDAAFSVAVSAREDLRATAISEAYGALRLAAEVGCDKALPVIRWLADAREAGFLMAAVSDVDLDARTLHAVASHIGHGLVPAPTAPDASDVLFDAARAFADATLPSEREFTLVSHWRQDFFAYARTVQAAATGILMAPDTGSWTSPGSAWAQAGEALPPRAGATASALPQPPAVLLGLPLHLLTSPLAASGRVGKTIDESDAARLSSEWHERSVRFPESTGVIGENYAEAIRVVRMQAVQVKQTLDFIAGHRAAAVAGAKTGSASDSLSLELDIR